MLAALGMLGAFGPLSMDMYLPSVPDLTRDLQTTDSLGQLTMSACMIGLSLGQLFIGPLSDRIGRRIPLLIGIAAFAIASALCAVAPSITMLLVFRLIQGVGGSAGLVLSMAVVRDLYEGKEAARIFSRLMLITGSAPVLAPILGGALLLFTSWRGVFVVLAAIGVLLFLAAWLAIPDTLAAEHRHSGAIIGQARDFGRIFRNGVFMSYALAGGLSGCALFVYISMSSFVLQNGYGVSAQAFSVIFAANAVGMVVTGQFNPLLLKRLSLRTILFSALAVSGVASLLCTISAVLGLGLLLLLAPLFFALCAQGLQNPNTSALALAPFARNAGAASAVMGTLPFLIGATVPPLVSLGGATAPIMAATMTMSIAAAIGVLLLAGRRRPITAALKASP